jgi:hypothetical protein
MGVQVEYYNRKFEPTTIITCKAIPPNQAYLAWCRKANKLSNQVHGREQNNFTKNKYSSLFVQGNELVEHGNEKVN